MDVYFLWYYLIFIRNFFFVIIFMVLSVCVFFNLELVFFFIIKILRFLFIVLMFLVFVVVVFFCVFLWFICWRLFVKRMVLFIKGFFVIVVLGWLFFVCCRFMFSFFMVWSCCKLCFILNYVIILVVMVGLIFLIDRKFFFV